MQWYASLVLKQSLDDINAQPKLFSRELYEKYLLNDAPDDFHWIYIYYIAVKKIIMRY